MCNANFFGCAMLTFLVGQDSELFIFFEQTHTENNNLPILCKSEKNAKNNNLTNLSKFWWGFWRPMWKKSPLSWKSFCCFWLLVRAFAFVCPFLASFWLSGPAALVSTLCDPFLPKIARANFRARGAFLLLLLLLFCVLPLPLLVLLLLLFLLLLLLCLLLLLLLLLLCFCFCFCFALLLLLLSLLLLLLVCFCFCCLFAFVFVFAFPFSFPFAFVLAFGLV